MGDALSGGSLIDRKANGLTGKICSQHVFLSKSKGEPRCFYKPSLLSAYIWLPSNLPMAMDFPSVLKLQHKCVNQSLTNQE